MRVSHIKEKLMHYSWELAYGFLEDPLKIDVTAFHVIKNPYKCKWFADPFILSEDERNLHLLVEEYDFSVGRGRIAHIVVDKGIDMIVSCTIVLDIGTHLSFPSIYRYGGTVYVVPENSKSGGLYMYRYDQINDLLVEPSLLVDRPLSDAVIFRSDGVYNIYATCNPTPNGNLMLQYVSDNFRGPYVWKCNYVFTSSIARMAGHMIQTENGLLRPAQDCNGAYGRAVLLMDGMDVACTIMPAKFKYAGLHTLNIFENTAVIDLKKYDYPLVEKLKRILL